MITACPHCGSNQLRGVELTDARELVVVCMGCFAAFEPEMRTDPCREMCNNCAFRQGSQERADPWRWLELLEATVEAGQPFHCHKNLRLQMTAEGYRFTPPEGGTAALTQCAGWKSRRAAFLTGVPLHRL